MRHLKRPALLGLLLLACLLLAGCRMDSTVEELFTLPRLPTEDTTLSRQLDQLLSEGYEYMAPTSGRNIQSLQMVDIDGDGQDEALAFFRLSNGEKPLKIYVFHSREDSYELASIIESSGTAIDSIYYEDLTGDGRKELIVGWKISSDVQTVTIKTPWVQSQYQQSKTYEVPAALDEQAAAAMAEAYDFLGHLEVSTGYTPVEPVEGKVNLFRSVEGARFTRYSDFVSYLNAVFTPELAQTYAIGAYFNEEWDFYLGGYMEGDNDELWQTAGDRGTNIYYCGTLFTEPETQPDGSVTFWQLSLQLDEEAFAGWEGEGPYVPAFAEPSLVRLVPTENGWRVAQLSLPY